MMTLNDLKKKDLIDELVKMGIRDENVLNAIKKVRREFFVKEEFKKYAYQNNALPIDCNQTISQPYTVAFMTEKLEVVPGTRILEVGTGSGYQAAILEEMGAEVYSVERIKELYLKALSTLQKLGYKVKLRYGDGSFGWEEHAPYKGIIVTAATPKIPEPLIDQLDYDGVLVIPVGDRISQQIWQVKKVKTEKDNYQLKINKFDSFRFVPLVWKNGWIE